MTGRGALVSLLILASACKAAPREVPAEARGGSGVTVQSRRSTARGDKLSWGGLVTSSGDRIRSATLSVVVRGAGGAEIGRAEPLELGELPAGHGVRVEVNGIPVRGEPERVEVTLERVERVEQAGQGDPPPWTPAAIAWESPPPDGVSFAALQDPSCRAVLGAKGAPATFSCTLGVRHTGTRRAAQLSLRFVPARGGDAIEVRPPHATDLPIEPGDALFFRVPEQPLAKPSEMILTGAASASR